VAGYTSVLRDFSDAHSVLGGTPANDFLQSGAGDNTLWGD
jgi:hypothetical protein